MSQSRSTIEAVEPPCMNMTPSALPELCDILAAGPAHLFYRHAQTLTGIFFTSLVRQYRNIVRSSRLQAASHPSSGQLSSVKAVVSAIPRHALVIRHWAIKQASVLRISVAQSWTTLNTQAVHKTALSQSRALDAFLGISDHDGTPSIQWDSITDALQSWIIKFHHNPALEEMAEQLVSDAGRSHPEGSIRFWPAIVRETPLLGRPEGTDASHPSRSSTGPASVASIASTDAFQSISETDRSELVRALGFTEVAFPGDEAASVATTAFAADRLSNKAGNC